MAVIIDRGRGGKEPTVPVGASLKAVAVDGGGGNGVVPATIDDNDNTMALLTMASSTNSGDASAMAVIVINCAAAVDAAAGGTLKNGYVHNVPLPQVPQIQSASPMTSHETIAPKVGISLPGYLPVTSWIPTLPKIGSILGFKYSDPFPQ